MKIQCDVCNKDEAIMFCVADEAALCAACDHRVHHANKLAGKHHRFSLLQPSNKDIPLCDICQEKRAFLFCQQDRAILCRDCDESIHKANQHTQKHNRFLLTGIKLSTTSSLYTDSSMPRPSIASPTSSITTSISNRVSYDVPSFNPQNSIKKPVSETPTNCFSQSSVKTSTQVQVQGGGNGELMNGSTSSISEYLIETLPGWHVEDFLDLSSANGFSKNIENEMQVQQFWDIDYSRNLHSSSTNCPSLWVPQVSPATQVFPDNTFIQPYTTSNIAFGAQMNFKDLKDASNVKPSRKRIDDNCFAVPQICPPSNTFKRSRNLW
ncbi:hypothetical protein Leryth_003619 [Lithospermum erythrorhizon]|nr:hypothetical protein Leryth_003619 [Lithospermum erythrorhizon]